MTACDLIPDNEMCVEVKIPLSFGPESLTSWPSIIFLFQEHRRNLIPQTYSDLCAKGGQVYKRLGFESLRRAILLRTPTLPIHTLNFNINIIVIIQNIDLCYVKPLRFLSLIYYICG
jgi:hypothetical protein